MGAKFPNNHGHHILPFTTTASNKHQTTPFVAYMQLVYFGPSGRAGADGSVEFLCKKWGNSMLRAYILPGVYLRCFNE